jgi:hypothetical protein
MLYFHMGYEASAWASSFSSISRGGVQRVIEVPTNEGPADKDHRFSRPYRLPGKRGGLDHTDIRNFVHLQGLADSPPLQVFRVFEEPPFPCGPASAAPQDL